MAYSLTWLPSVLKAAGLKVAEQPGWLDRGRGEMSPIKGVMCHHTVGPASGNMPSLKGLTYGVKQRNGKFLAGPLAQLGLGRDGTYYVIAAGRANHAGEGLWKGVANGNVSFIGIEAENTGLVSDVWPEVQLDAYARGCAAILKHVGRSADYCCGHKEYRLPKGYKIDPHTIDMDEFRAKVAAIMAGTGAVRPLIPAADASGNPTLRRGSRGEAVKRLQSKLKISPPDGVFGPMTEARVRQLQREKGLVADGIVGPLSWSALAP